MIPRLIHQVWIGPRTPPEKWLATWRDKNPGWEHRVWREDDIDDFGLVNRAAYDFLRQHKDTYPAASDIVRAEILLRFGGLYADADTVCNTPVAQWPRKWLNAGMFGPVSRPSLFAIQFIGAVPEHAAIRRWVELQGEVELTPDRPDLTWCVGGEVLIRALRSFDPPLRDVVTFGRGAIQSGRLARHFAASGLRRDGTPPAHRWDRKGWVK